MARDALETVKLRNNFYRDSYRKIVVALLASFVAIAGLIIAIVILVADKPVPKYFATTDSGRIIPLIPLNQPNLSSNALLQWASQAVISIYSYNFVNYQKAFQDGQQYFTTAGWRSFMNALDSTKTIDAVKSKKLIVSAVVNGAPVITNQYVLSGKYTWEIQVPFLVNYQGTETYSQNLIATMKIQRISTLDNNYGVGISSFVVQQKS
jgi:intracellular multiplication protein IcmL